MSIISSEQINDTCNKVIDSYHAQNSLELAALDFYFEDALVQLVADKCLIDTIQWHLEDEIRSPQLDAEAAWKIKHKIDAYNQKRTDTVEAIDVLLYKHFTSKEVQLEAQLNSETPGWIIDRMSILCLKIYHMREQVERKDVDEAHIQNCEHKLNILLEQQTDLSKAFDMLLFDLEHGRKYMKLYLQMKMYNDKNLNPALYKSKDN